MIFELKNKDTKESLGFYSEKEALDKVIFFESLDIPVELLRDSTPVILANSLGLTGEDLNHFKEVLQDEIDDHE